MSLLIRRPAWQRVLLAAGSIAALAAPSAAAACGGGDPAACAATSGAVVSELELELAEDSEAELLDVRLLQSRVQTSKASAQSDRSAVAAADDEAAVDPDVGTAAGGAPEVAATAAATSAPPAPVVDAAATTSAQPVAPAAATTSAPPAAAVADPVATTSAPPAAAAADAAATTLAPAAASSPEAGAATAEASNETASTLRHSQDGKVCFETRECCPFDEPGSVCEYHCKEGKEIDKTDVRGWRLKGVCTKKVEGFCTEDEDCGFAYYCERGSDSLSGTCMRDELCANSTCVRGHCRKGMCTCDYGVSGPHCDHSTEAFAFLFYGNSSENLISVRVMIQSLRAAGGQQDIVAVIPKNMVEMTPQEHLDVLQGDNVKLYYPDPIFMPESMDKDPIIHSRWSGVMNKFAVWRLEQYSQVALMDTDMVFAFDSETPDALFEECNAPICAVRDGDSRFMNAGVMVIMPSTQRLDHIMHVLHNEQHHFAMPEQSFLTMYCKNPSYKMKLQFLDKKWNSCVGGGMMHNIGWESTGYNILHSCSWQSKPPSMRMCLPGSCDVEEEWHTVLAWQHFHMQVDPCIMSNSEAECMAAIPGSCQWCAQYCGTAKISCNTKLFNETKVNDIEEPDFQTSQQLLGIREVSGSEFLEAAKESAPWNDLPRGAWAWPQVAMYQILIDRFNAVPAPEHCEKLDDYCGGNLAGIRDKMEYLESLGVDGVVLSPVVEQMPHGYHGYWTKDLTKVNPQYGTEDELRELVVLLHERGMKVISDVNLNHAGGPKMNASNPDDVSILKPFDKPEYYHSDNCSLIHNEDYDRGAHFLERCKLYGLPDYNQENPKVWQRLQRFVREHVDMYGFDGIRVDAARHISRPFLDHIPESGPPIPAFFEVVNGQLSYIAGYAGGDYNAIYNYPLYYTLVDIFVPAAMQAPMSDLGDWMVKEGPKAQGRLLLNFLENNDLPRFIYKLDGDLLLYHNALLCILGMEGLPVLLYGSEQNARGILNFTDPLKVDNWRPALWHYGFNESTPTFQMVQKVLWIRNRMNGMHTFRQQPVYSDHHVLIWTRGPMIFAVTNTGNAKKRRSQRVVWDNATNTDGTTGAFNKTTWVCNLLAVSPRDDCGLVSPKNISRLHLAGEPKMYVPFSFVKEFEDHVAKAADSEELLKAQSSPEMHVMPFSDWHKIPSGPSVKAKAQKRTARAWTPSDVHITDNQHYSKTPFPKLPPFLDLWSPPVGMPTTHLIEASSEDTCFYLGAGESDGALFLQREGTTYVLCPDAREWCPETINKNVDLSKMLQVVGQARISQPLPVVHLTFDVWYGVYHLVVGALPGISPFLPQLQSGTMRAFMHAGKKVVSPVLAMLGITNSVIFTPSDPPLSEPYHFCTPKMHFTMSTRPSYPRVEYVSEYLTDFRQALQATTGPRPCGAKTYGIVILSRGNVSRSIKNEAELATSLQSLGRPVQIMDPEPARFLDLVQALSHADVIVGGHGANMANMIYAPEGTKVVEIVPQVNIPLEDYHFRDLAGALNFTYVPVAQQIRADEYNLGAIGDAMHMDKAVNSYHVDVRKVTAVVQTLIEP